MNFGSISGKTIVAIAGGSFHPLALDSTGSVHAWGLNVAGQLGNNTTVQSNIPILVNFGSISDKTIVAIACGRLHTIALDSTGAVHTWGYNTTIDSAVPMNVTLNAKTIVAVACGRSHTLALDSAGTVHAWGNNDDSQLGDNLLVNRLVPYAVSTSYAPLASTGAAIFVNFTGQHRCFVDDPLVPRLQPHHEGLIVVTNKDKYATMEMKGRRGARGKGRCACRDQFARRGRDLGLR